MVANHIGGRPGTAATCGLVANVFLGLSSLYWKALGNLSPFTLLFCRIVLSLLSLLLLLACLGRLRTLWGKISARTCAIHACAAGLVVINWGSFIWASINAHVLESGLGYLVAPIVTIAIGALAFKERVTRARALALCAISIAVLWLILHSGELAHWVYLTIGLTWGGYACLKKLTDLDSIAGLFVETLVLTALIPVILASTDIRLAWPENMGLAVHILLLCAGVVSAFPLYLFAKVAAELPLSVMGLFQFVLPTTQLLVALLIYRQALSGNSLACFAAIWIALSVIVLEPIFDARRMRS